MLSIKNVVKEISSELNKLQPENCEQFIMFTSTDETSFCFSIGVDGDDPVTDPNVNGPTRGRFVQLVESDKMPGTQFKIQFTSGDVQEGTLISALYFDANHQSLVATANTIFNYLVFGIPPNTLDEVNSAGTLQ